MTTTSSRFSRRFISACFGALPLLAATVTHAAVTSDLHTDWNDASNPNGLWTIRAGNTVLPQVSNWALDSFSTPQGGWSTSSSSLPFWFRSTSTPLFIHDWQPNDIIVHTEDGFHGASGGVANVIWTSPLTGTLDITGGVWECRDIGSIGGGLRGNRWNLYVQDTLISTGTVGGGDPYSRANPFTFDLGSGGAAALDDISVSVGDIVRLELVRTSADGDYVGVNFGIVAIPEPSTFGLLAVAAASFLVSRRRKHS